jgi:hypothetical protein
VVLSFQEHEIKHQVKFINGAFDLVKCGNNVFGSAGTGRISAWNISSAPEALNDDDEPVNPRTTIVDHDKNFGCGDLHVADKSRLFVSPARDDAVRSSSIRLYDFNAESVVGLLANSIVLILTAIYSA